MAGTVTLRVLLRSPFSPYSGYGNDGLGLADAMVRAGLDVYLQPTHVGPPVTDTVARLLTKTLAMPFDINLQHIDPGQLECEKVHQTSATWNVGWTMWEFTSLANMDKGALRTLKRRTERFDLLLAYDPVCADALREHVTCPVEVLQGGYDPAPWEYVDRPWSDDVTLRYAMQGALHGRKDPFVAIQAFNLLKAEHGDDFKAELHLKTAVPGLHPKMAEVWPGIEIHYATWPLSVLRDFYARVHVLLSPSHGEGKNLPALEFATTGGAVAATNWGGHTMWLSSEIGWPLDYVLRDEPGVPGCQSARVAAGSLAAVMWTIYTNRAEAQRRGKNASNVLPYSSGWDRVLERLFEVGARAGLASGDRILSTFRERKAWAEHQRETRAPAVR